MNFISFLFVHIQIDINEDKILNENELKNVEIVAEDLEQDVKRIEIKGENTHEIIIQEVDVKTEQIEIQADEDIENVENIENFIKGNY